MPSVKRTEEEKWWRSSCQALIEVMAKCFLFLPFFSKKKTFFLCLLFRRLALSLRAFLVWNVVACFLSHYLFEMVLLNSRHTEPNKQLPYNFYHRENFFLSLSVVSSFPSALLLFFRRKNSPLLSFVVCFYFLFATLSFKNYLFSAWKCVKAEMNILWFVRNLSNWWKMEIKMK